jgi:sugar phosphate isomerase/epimerase
VHGTWKENLSLAAHDEARRRAAVEETLATLEVAAAVPYSTLVLHAGVPEPIGGAADNHLASLVKSLEALSPAAEGHGVRLAVEVIPNVLSTASSLVNLVESDIEASMLGICMDVGHARLMGDVVDAIETCSGHLITTHLHDNRGRSDDHLVPGKGVIDWDAAVLAFQKIGYDGVWMFELAATLERKATLEQAIKARERFEALLHIGDEMLGMDET